MPITIDTFHGVGGSPPTHIRVSGTKTNCESVVVWLVCGEKQSNPYPPFPQGSVAGPWSYDVPYRGECGCGDTLTVVADCHAGSGVPSPAAVTLTDTLVCDECCPEVKLKAPTVTGLAPNAVASFEVGVGWKPTGCTPQLTATSFHWTVTTPAGHDFVLTTAAPRAKTSEVGWRLNGMVAPLELSAAGAYTVKVRVVYAGTLGSSCDPTDAEAFTVQPPLPCCPQSMTHPHGVSIKYKVSGPAPATTVSFTASIQWPPNCTPVAPASYEWEITDPNGKKFARSTTNNTTDTSENWVSGGVNVGPLTFPVGGNYLVNVAVAFPTGSAAAGCSVFDGEDFQIEDTMPQVCCPAAGVTASMTTASGTVPTASFSATVTWPSGCPQLQPTTLDWELTDLTAGSTHRKTTTTPTTNETGWTPALTLSAGSAYDVKVTPTFAGVTLPAGCDPSGSVRSSTPPGPTTTTTTNTTASCPWWCWLLGILFISIPISAFISTYAHCLLGPIGIFITSLVITASIFFSIFILRCSVCCLWIIIVIGLVLAIIAYIIYAIAAFAYGQPAVQLTCSSASLVSGAQGGLLAGIGMWFGFLATAIAFKLACDAMGMSSSGPSTTSASSGLMSRDRTDSGRRGIQAIGTAPMASSGTTIHTERLAGLGDAVSSAAVALGIEPCGGCQKRAARLNRLVPF